jgi:HSP20 family protein
MNGITLKTFNHAAPFLSGVPSFFDTPRTLFNDLWETTAITSIPKIDILDKSDHYEVRVEVPGLTKDQVEVSLDKRRLDVSLNTKVENETNESHYYLKESREQRYSRSVIMPNDMDENHISEAYIKNGILSFTVGKIKSETKDTKRISIK